MYIPEQFVVNDKEKIFDFIHKNSFGILFSQSNGKPAATHLPFLLETENTPDGILWGHFARANNQWKEIDNEHDVLVVFHGPHAYISPTWYSARNMVPTWNYAAVHAYGKFTLIDDTEQMVKLVKDLTGYYESSLPSPWEPDAPPEIYSKMVNGIMGFKIEITRLEGKWKLNQNHPAELQEKVIRALRNSTDQNELAIADLMEENLKK